MVALVAVMIFLLILFVIQFSNQQTEPFIAYDYIITKDYPEHINPGVIHRIVELPTD